MPCSTLTKYTFSHAARQPLLDPIEKQKLAFLGQERRAVSFACKPVCPERRAPKACSSVQRQQRRPRPARIVVRASVDTEAEDHLQIEGIDRAYCDEFVCTSSPQVNISPHIPSHIVNFVKDHRRINQYPPIYAGSHRHNFRVAISLADVHRSSKMSRRWPVMSPD